MLKMYASTLGMILSLSSLAFAANESPQSFTLDGKLYTADGITPLRDATAKIRVQVLNPSKSCVLYDEEQTVNTMSSDGHFNIQVGSAVGALKRKSMDSGNTMALVYQNVSSIPGSSCTYAPVAGDVRYIRVVVTPTSSASETLSPDMILDAVPNAVVAQSLQGVEKSGFLQTNPAAQLTQSRLEQLLQTLTGVTGMGVSYNGSNFVSYDPHDGGALTTGSVTDTQIGSVSWAKISSVPPAINAVATLSCVNGEILKFVSGAWACATESGVGSESDPTVEAYAKNAPGAGLTVSSGAIVPDFGTTAGKVAQGNDSRFTDSRAPNGSATGDLSGSYPNPTVAKIQGRAVSLTAPADGQVLKYDNGSSTWVPSSFGISDLKKSNGLPQFISASCSSSQTLIWSAVTDDFSCTSISLPVGQITGTLAIANGGTGQTTATAAFNALAPAQTSNSGKYLTTNGTTTSWATVSYTETDPKVGANTTNYLSKWNGTALVASTVIESGGNVGIGTTNPIAQLHLTSTSTDVKISGGSPFYGTFVDISSSASGGWARESSFGHNGTKLGSFGMTGIDGTPGYLYLNANQGGSVSGHGAPSMAILPSGNVGIGTTSPTTKLDVNGTINATAMTINGVPVGTATGMTSLNGSSQVTQTFTNGTSGTTPAFNTVVGTGVHTLNIPMANTASVTAGLISKTEFDAFNSKVGTSYSLAGDVTGTPAATVVDRIKGVAVSAAPTLAGQVLRYSGSQLVPAFVSMTDLRSQTTGTTALASSCASNQTLTYNSVGDNLTCSNISLPVGQITGALAIANGGTGQTTASAAFDALAPVQTSNSGKYLTTNGTTTSWATVSYTETDPKVGSNTTNYLSKWNGTALVASTVIESSGNVGIGTTSPTQKLENSGSRTAFGNDGGSSFMHWFTTNAGTSEPNNLGYGFQASGGSVAAHMFRTSGLERMRIDSSGNVGVGTTTPAAKLDVAGEVRFGNSGLACNSGTSGAMRYNGGAMEYCNGTSWSGISSSSTQTIYSQVLTSGTSWTSPAGITASTKFKIIIVGGGGGGGGANRGMTGGAGGGGGGGGTVIWYVSGLTASTSYSISIGAAGAAGAATPAAGGAGGSSSITIGGTTVTASGGAGGAAGNSAYGAGGAGGTTTNGSVQVPGQSGEQGTSSGSGEGGSSSFGFGARAIIAGGAVVPGTAGTGYGAGGSGGVAISSTGTTSGGAGSQGAIFIESVF